MAYELYGYQKEIIYKVWHEFAHGKKAIMVVSPAGSGKSVIISDIIKTLTDEKKYVYFMVHRKELVEQIRADLIASDVNMDYVTVTSVIKLKNRLGKLPDPYMIVTDETHHSKANSYMEIYKYYDKALRLGFTATPVRLSGEGFKDVYDTMVEGKSVKWLIENHYLAPFKYYSLSVLNRKKLKKNRGEYTNKSISSALDQADIFGKVVDTYLDKAKGQQAILYAHSVEFSKKYAKEFQDAGISAIHVDSETPAEERERIMTGFKNKEYQILCNVDLVSEGFNVPDCNTVILMRPTESLTVFIQQSMRGMRYRPNKQSIIIDHVGNYLKHGLPTTEHFWSLEKSKDEGQVESCCCKICKGVFENWLTKKEDGIEYRVCPNCGHRFMVFEKEVEPNTDKVEDKDAKLEEITAEDQEYLELRKLANSSVNFKWNIKRIVAIFVAKHKLSLMEGEVPKIKSPIYFAIRKFLEINDLETLNKGWLFNQLKEISNHYNDEYKVNYNFLVQYTEKLIPEYLNKQRQARRRYGYRH